MCTSLQGARRAGLRCGCRPPDAFGVGSGYVPPVPTALPKGPPCCQHLAFGTLARVCPVRSWGGPEGMCRLGLSSTTSPVSAVDTGRRGHMALLSATPCVALVPADVQAYYVSGLQQHLVGGHALGTGSLAPMNPGPCLSCASSTPTPVLSTSPARLLWAGASVCRWED